MAKWLRVYYEAEDREIKHFWVRGFAYEGTPHLSGELRPEETVRVDDFVADYLCCILAARGIGPETECFTRFPTRGGTAEEVIRAWAGNLQV